MIPESDPDTTVRRFDLSQQFTAMQRISVVLSRATEASKTLQEVLSVLHNDAFMQHGMICLYDSEQEILSIEALQQTGQQPLPGSTQIRYRPGEGLVGTVLAQGQSLVLPRVADDQRFLDRLSLYDYDLPFIAVPLMGPNARPIGVLAAQPMAQIVAEVALAFNHLWEDLGLDSRAELGRLMSDCFPQLVVQNVHHMRWKKFFYRQRCLQSQGEIVCRSPSCDECLERSLCFEPPPL